MWDPANWHVAVATSTLFWNSYEKKFKCEHIHDVRHWVLLKHGWLDTHEVLHVSFKTTYSEG